jgi:hypothetical protein
MKNIARFKILIVIIISIYFGWIAIEHLDKSWRNSDDWYNSSESVRNRILFLINVILLPLLIIVIYSLFCTIQATLYPFISRYAYFLYIAGYRYELVKGRAGFSTWSWVKKYGKLRIEVAYHGHLADRNLMFRNKVTYIISGIDMCDQDLVEMKLNERVNRIYNGSRVYTIDPKGGVVIFSINDYFDTSDYKQSLKAAEFVLNTVKEYSNKRSH